MERAEMNDAKFIGYLGMEYMDGGLGLPKDIAKGLELLTRAVNLGDGDACNALGELYWHGEDGVVPDRAKARLYWEHAAKKGDDRAKASLGVVENEDGNVRVAMEHWRIAAASGNEISMANLICYFERDVLRHRDLAWCLQAKDKACIEMKSKQRTEFVKYDEEFGPFGGQFATQKETQYWADRLDDAAAPVPKI